jgi:hypothetical protein
MITKCKTGFILTLKRITHVAMGRIVPIETYKQFFFNLSEENEVKKEESYLKNMGWYD